MFPVFFGQTLPSPAGMERSGIPVRVHGMVSFGWIANCIIFSAKIKPMFSN
jgi:hypothetical protein